MQYILFWYSTWFILEINQCIPHDWNGLRSLFLLPATCNFWFDFYCRSPILQGTKDLWHDGSASAPRRYSDFSSGETTFWALKYFLSQQDHMFFLPSTLLFFFARCLKNCTSDWKGVVYFSCGWDKEQPREIQDGAVHDSEWSRL